jgi:hypothetical protein
MSPEEKERQENRMLIQELKMDMKIQWVVIVILAVLVIISYIKH